MMSSKQSTKDCISQGTKSNEKGAHCDKGINPEEKSNNIGRRCSRRRSEGLDILKLRACLRRIWVPAALFDRLPLVSDNLQSLFPILRDGALHKITANHHPSPSNPTTTMNSRDPASCLVIVKDLERLMHFVQTIGQGTIANGKTMIFDFLRVDSLEDRAPAKDIGI